MQKKTFFSFLAAGFSLKYLAFARKMMVLPDSEEGTAASRPSGAYAYD